MSNFLYYQHSPQRDQKSPTEELQQIQKPTDLETIIEAIIKNPTQKHLIKIQAAWKEWIHEPILRQKILAYQNNNNRRICWHYIGPQKMGLVSLPTLKKEILSHVNAVHLVRLDTQFDWLSWREIRFVYEWVTKDTSIDVPSSQWKTPKRREYHIPQHTSLREDTKNTIERTWAKLCLDDLQSNHSAWIFDLGNLFIQSKKARKQYNHFGDQNTHVIPAFKTIALRCNRNLDLSEDSPQQVGERNPLIALRYWKYGKTHTLSKRRRYLLRISRESNIPLHKVVDYIQNLLQEVMTVRYDDTSYLTFFGKFQKHIRIYGKHQKTVLKFTPNDYFLTKARERGLI